METKLLHCMSIIYFLHHAEYICCSSSNTISLGPQVKDFLSFSMIHVMDIITTKHAVEEHVPLLIEFVTVMWPLVSLTSSRHLLQLYS